MVHEYDNANSTAIARRDAMREAAHRSAHAAGRAPSTGTRATPQQRDGMPTAEVFISYSQADRDVAQSLADFFAGLGIATWWDREIQSGQDYRSAIDAALRAAKAVIVIWSETSVAKEYVLNEATYARNKDKLITVHIPGFEEDRIPIGFILRQSESVEERARLVRSLGRFGIYPAP